MEKLDGGKDIDERRKCMEQKSSQSENSMFLSPSSPTAINGEQKINGKINTCFPDVLNPEEDKTKNSEGPEQNLAENPCRSGTLQPTLPKPSSLLLSRDPLQFSMSFAKEVPEDLTRETESELELERRKKEPKNKEPSRDQEIQNLGQENDKNIDYAEKTTRDKDVQKTCPSKTGGRIQNEEQKSSPLKEKEKGRALQSTSHTSNTFDVLDTLLDKLSEENIEPSHNQEIGLVISESQVQGAPEKCMKKEACSNTTSRKSKFKKENLSQPKNQEHSEFQITNDLPDSTTNQHYLLTTFPGANKQDQNEVTGTHNPLIPMKNKQKIGGKDLANFQQNDGPEESKSKQHRVPGSSLTDYRSTEKLQPDVPTYRNLPHPNSQLENLPFPETDPYNEQQKESKVKKRKKKNEDRKLEKKKKEESIQRTVQSLLQVVQTMEKIAANLRSNLRKSKH